MGFFKKIGKAVKKIGKVALPAAAAYYGAPMLGAAASSVFGGTRGPTSATPGQSSDGTTLPPVTVEGSTPNWFRENSGALLQGGLSFLGQSQANKANARQAQNQMDFQSQMSNTAYQRGTKDMMDAGLNPMLAYSQGGASAPGGASSTIQDAITPAVSNARQGQMQKQQLLNLGLTNEQLAAQTENINAQRRATDAQTTNYNLMPKQIEATIGNLIASGDLTRAQEAQLRGIGPYLIQQAKLGNTGSSYDLSQKKAEAEFYDTLGGWAKTIPSVTGAITSAGAGIRYLLGNTTSKKIGGLTVKSTTRPGR